MDTVMAIIRRDLSLVMRQGSDAFVVLIFFVVVDKNIFEIVSKFILAPFIVENIDNKLSLFNEEMV